MKLFRSFRIAFIKKENFKRYLLYAIGEIILVMVGISLAFQLDNWNTRRINNNIEIGYYKNIKAQITGDKSLLQHQQNFNRSLITQLNYANKLIETNDRTHLDSLGKIVGKMTQYSDFDKQGNIYETMVNSGEIKLLRNLNIVNGIRELEEKYSYLNRMETIHYDAMITYVVQAIQSTIKFSTGEVMQPEKIFSYEFQNLILALIQIMTEKEAVYNQTISQIDHITALVNKELDNP